jgi:molybdopterin-binding protein
MDTLTSREAAALLRLTVKRVQGLARSGRLPAVRVGRKWLFRREELEHLLGRKAPGWAGPFGTLSARNHLLGRVVGLKLDGIMAEVRVGIGDQELVSIITRASAERLGLSVGKPVYAVIKSTEVMIGTEQEL